ncbi:MAG: hypothetical protein AAFY59_11050 [Pseudomonadota bacterium]
MKLFQALGFVCVLSASTAASSDGRAPADDLVAMGAYVATDDIGRSETFYRVLFEREPVLRLDDFVAFDISGGWFAIVSRERYAPTAMPGSGAVPYIRSSDLEAVRARAADALGEAAPDILVEPGIRLLKISDPDGQLIEFFALEDG